MSQSHIKGYVARTKSGGMKRVRDYEAERKKKPVAAKKATKPTAQKPETKHVTETNQGAKYIWTDWQKGAKGGISRWEKKSDAEAAMKVAVEEFRKKGWEVEGRLDSYTAQPLIGGGTTGRAGWGYSWRSRSGVDVTYTPVVEKPSYPKNPVSRKDLLPQKKFKVVNKVEAHEKQTKPEPRPRTPFKRTKLKVGLEVVFSHPSSVRAIKGNVVRIYKKTVSVMGKRRGDGSQEKFVLPHGDVLALRDWQAMKSRAAERRAAQSPYQSATDTRSKATKVVKPTVSLSRKEALEKRLKMTEGQIFATPRMIGYLKAQAEKYRKGSGLTPEHFDPLLSEMTMGMLAELRRRIPEETPQRVKDFKEHLAGKKATSDIWWLSAHGGKKAMIKYIRDYRQQRLHEESWDLQAAENPLSDFVSDEMHHYLRKKFGASFAVAPAQDEVVFASEEMLPVLMEGFVSRLPQAEGEVIRYKYGIGRHYVPDLSNDEIAERIAERLKNQQRRERQAEKKGEEAPPKTVPVFKDETGKEYSWTRNTVGKTVASGIRKLKEMEGIETLKHYHKAKSEYYEKLYKAHALEMGLGGGYKGPLGFVRKAIHLMTDMVKSKLSTIAAASADQKTACVDFDGVIAQYEGDGNFNPHVFGEPVEGAIEALKKLKAEGWRIIIHTCRQDNEELRAWLVSKGIPYDQINSPNPVVEGEAVKWGISKPMADVYIDDRAVRFTSWADTFDQLKKYDLKKAIHIGMDAMGYAKGMGWKATELDLSFGKAIWVDDDDLEKSYSSDLKAKYPAGRWVTITEGPLQGRHIFIVPHPNGTATIIVGGGPALRHKVIARRDEGGGEPDKPRKDEVAVEAKAEEAQDEPKKDEPKEELPEERRQELEAKKTELKTRIQEVRAKMGEVLREHGVTTEITPAEQKEIEKKVKDIADAKERAAARAKETHDVQKKHDEEVEKVIAEAKRGLLLTSAPEGVPETTEATAPTDKQGQPTLQAAVRQNYEDLLNSYYEIRALKRENSEINRILNNGKDRSQHVRQISFTPLTTKQLQDIIIDENVRDEEIAAHYRLATTAKGFVDAEGAHKAKYESEMGNFLLKGGYEALTGIVGEATGSTILGRDEYDLLGPQNAATLARYHVEGSSDNPTKAVEELNGYLQKRGTEIAQEALKTGDSFMDMAKKVVAFAKAEDAIMDYACAQGTTLMYQRRAYEAYGQAEGALSQAAEMVYAFADKPQPIEFTAKTRDTLYRRRDALGLDDGDVNIEKDGDTYSMVVKTKAYEKLIKEKPLAGHGMGLSHDDKTYSPDEIKAFLANTDDFKPTMMKEYTDPDKDGNMERLSLKPEQQAAVRLVASLGKMYLNFPAGTGKSATVIATKAHLDDLHEKAGKEKVKTIVAMPTNIVDNFKDEVTKWSGYNVIKITGKQSPEKRRKLLMEAGPNDIVVTNHETFRTSQADVLASNFGFIVADEAHKITQRDKAGKSQKSQALHEIVDKAPYYVAMSGTPTPSDLSQLYFHLSLINPEKYHSQKEFMDKYGSAHRGGGLKDKIANIMEKEMGENVYTIAKELNTKFNMHVHYTPLSKEQKAEYRDTQDSYKRKEIGTFHREARHKKTLNDMPWQTNGKFGEIKNIVEDHLKTAGPKEKIIFYAESLSAINNIKDYLRHNYPQYGVADFSGHNKGGFDSAKNKFQGDDNVKFAVHSNAGVEGLNLQYTGDRGGATTAIAIGSGVDGFAKLDQFFSRGNRMGAVKDVTGHLVFSDTPFDMGTQVRIEDKKRIGQMLHNASNHARKKAA